MTPDDMHRFARRLFTMNPATPHPDQEPDEKPWPLEDAIRYALHVLKKPDADQLERTRAYFHLNESFHEDGQK